MGDRFAIVSTTSGSVASATGLSLVTAANAAAARTTLSVSPVITTQRPFTVADWTIVAPVAPGAGIASFEAGDIGRVSLTSAAGVSGIDGPRLERAWPTTTMAGEPVRVRATVDSKVGVGTGWGQMYIRSGSTVWTIGARTNDSEVFTYNWNGDIINVPALAVWDGTMVFDIYVAGGSICFATEIAGTRTYLRAPAAQNFYPTHWGIEIGSNGAVTGSVDFHGAVEIVG